MTDYNSPDIKASLFDRKITCPICGNEFTTKSVKVNSVRIASKDSDFFVRYKTGNPYLYDIWTCEKCGYTAMKSDFDKIKSFEKDILKEQLLPKWKERHFNEIMTPSDALEKYKLALINASILGRSKGTLGFILLRIAWMYRLEEDEEKENHFLTQSVKCFEEAFSTEPFPIYGLQRDSLTYLIGDLYRRIGEYDKALTWYSNVITTVGANYKFKEMARNGRDMIKEMKLQKNA
ncbi:DUF2225 domain-containing protein [Clostridium sp. MSJ-8]|uniref:DUF2225 domain-containing protein n=1 Tax=Clostridium sp. MSJ-8 TaxID=2841510 RepID=UPI001C0EC50E|nr:DUF2225 domain-containing protein [Clostridium sp. MSJ-8]MBU5488218.1 DUF2225 domain-containing protein [Clostridium sp. MSJ-8]